MKTKKDDGYDRIELRSEKVRNIIGMVPPALVRWGNAVITIILIILMLVMFLAPYPYGKGETIFQHLKSTPRVRSSLLDK